MDGARGAVEVLSQLALLILLNERLEGWVFGGAGLAGERSTRGEACAHHGQDGAPVRAVPIAILLHRNTGSREIAPLHGPNRIVRQAPAPRVRRGLGDFMTANGKSPGAARCRGKSTQQATRSEAIQDLVGPEAFQPVQRL